MNTRGESKSFSVLARTPASFKEGKLPYIAILGKVFPYRVGLLVWCQFQAKIYPSHGTVAKINRKFSNLKKELNSSAWLPSSPEGLYLLDEDNPIRLNFDDNYYGCVYTNIIGLWEKDLPRRMTSVEEKLRFLKLIVTLEENAKS